MMTLKGAEIFKKLWYYRRDTETAEKISFFICRWDAGKWKPTSLRQV